MKNIIIQLPKEYKDLLSEELYQSVKTLEEISDNIENPALLYWAREDVIREALEIMEDNLPANTDGIPWNKEDEPACLAYRQVLGVAVDIKDIKPDTPLLDSTIRPLPPVCLKLKQSHPDLYALLKALEKDVSVPVAHEEMYFARNQVLIDYEDKLDKEYDSLKKEDPESDSINEILKDYIKLDICEALLQRGDM